MPIHTLAEFASRAGPATFPAGAIALTLDDGPHAIWTPKILRLLAKLDVKATFFMIGVQAKGHPDLVRAIADGGHVVGNHTYNHLLLPKLSVPNIRQQIVATQDAVHNACGTYPKVFRAPGGAWSPAVLTEVAAAETVPLHWQVDTNDWSRPGTGAIERRLRGAGSGAVILCHDGGGDRSQTYAALGRAIPALKARGHQFVTLDDRH
jgi:peptidoglycan/xylan/chitin deacetylase (PgdA/CDA1 family)